ncbi:MAG: hypothetical protein HW390_2696 [Candidatus Brocadiaceae bacterium]|nr:hypothetical protein [Candidatus Brocadiaceae bacterium]
MRSKYLAGTRNFLGVLKYRKALFLVLLTLACFASSLHAGKGGQTSLPDIIKTRVDACPDKKEIFSKIRTLQMPFIANNGQMDDQVKFYAKTFGGTVFVTKDGEIVYALPDNNNSSVSGVRRFESDSGLNNHRSRRPEGWVQGNGESCLMEHASVAVTPSIGVNGLNQLSGLDAPSLFNTFYTYLNSLKPTPRAIALKETLIGAKISGIAGEHPAVTTVNYFTGNDKSKWKTNVPTYNVVNLGEVYKGVDLSLRAYGDNVEKLFCVKPGSSPEMIKVLLDGSKSLWVNRDGQLEADTDLGLVKFTKPIAYQEIEGKRMEVAVDYCIVGTGIEGKEGRGEFETQNPKLETINPKLTYGFTVAAYDKTKDLIIDPLLASTFLGGSDGYNYVSSLVIDPNGNVYVTGHTNTTDFLTTSGAYDTSFNGYSDVFISKLNGGLTSLLASTFLGGSDGYNEGVSLAIDAGGNVYVAGNTSSTDFPTTSGAYDTSYNDSSGYDTDVFVSKLDGSLTSLLASTYLGGSGYDNFPSLAIDAGGNVCVAGLTSSSDFPTTSGAYDTSINGNIDVFVSRLDGGLTSLPTSTFLGGSGEDSYPFITLDAGGNVYVTGMTGSSDFPTTSGAYDASFNGSSNDIDVFVSKLDGGLTSLLASTFLGGSGYDFNYNPSFALDVSGNVYVTGNTHSTDFPTTSGAYDTSYNDSSVYDTDVFVSKLDGSLTSLLASTYLGGSGFDYDPSLVLDTSGNVYVSGNTGSTDFPATSGAYDTSRNDRFEYPDVFVSKLDGGLTSLLASTYLGGTGYDEGRGLVLDTGGNVYVAGITNAKNFPTTSGAYDTSFTDNGYLSVFISKLDGDLSSDISCTYSISPDSQTFSCNGGDGSVEVTASSGSCSWTAVSSAYWLTITSGSSGTGNGTVAYEVLANTGSSPRTGTMTIAGRTFTVTQDGFSCSYTLSPTSQTFSAGGGAGTVGVTSSSGSCGWTAVSNTAWVTITAGGSETGNGTVYYSVSANTSKTLRTGTITIAEQSFTVTQDGVCTAKSITVAPDELTIRKNENGDVTVTVMGAHDCPVKRVTVTATINGKDKKLIEVSPGSQETDVNGQAVFSISAKSKKGTAVVGFKAEGMDKLATVQVKVRQCWPTEE